MSSSVSPNPPTDPLAFLAGGGELGERIRKFDWSQNPLGVPTAWSPALRTMVQLLLTSRHPMLLWWGPKHIGLYNDAARPLLGDNHPFCFGLPARDCWREMWQVLQPLFDGLVHGQSEWKEETLLVIQRDDLADETHWLLHFSPVPDDTAERRMGGVLATVSEATEKVLSERRMRVLRLNAGVHAEEQQRTESQQPGRQSFPSTKPAEEQLQRERDLLRVTIESIGDAVLTTDTEGRVTNMNSVAESLTGWTSDAAIGQPLEAIFRIVNETTRRTVENPALRALREGIVVGLANHTVLLNKNGTECPIEDSAAPIRTREGELIGCVLVFRDVRERRADEKRLQESELRYRLVGQAANDIIWDWNLVTNEVVWNEGVQRVFGYAEHDVRADAGWWIENIHPADRERISADIHRALDEGAAHWQNEYRYRRADNTYAEVFDRGQVVRQDGKPVRMVGSMQDLTERNRAAAALKAAEERFAFVRRSSGVGFWYCDLPFDVLQWDEQVKSHFHLSPAAHVTIETFYERIHPDDRQPTQAAIERSITEHTSYDVVYRTVDPASGSLKWIRAIGRTFYADNDTPIRFDGVTIDVSEQKRVEAELREVAAELSEAGHRKDEFLATLSHELRNPLAPIRNALQLMRLSSDPQIQEDSRTMMERQLSQMVRLVDDLMDVSRITRGKVELRREQVPLATIVSSAVETSRPLIEAMGHTLRIDLSPHPVTVNADVTRLAQVFSNLLNNACKYSERGGRIELIVERSEGEAILRVRDNGVGIAADQLPRIFEMFAQVDRSIDRSQGGLGIGLTLVRRLVEMHGGTVEATSAGLGQGSEFIVRLPLAIDVPQTSAVGQSELVLAKTKLRILIVDDNRDAADSVAMMLKLVGNELHTAYDGESGVEAAAKHRPDVILFDIGLPKLNGYEACRRIRELPWGQKPIIIAVTGWGQEEDRRRSRDAGFDHHLVKPVDPMALMQFLATVSVAERL